MVPISPTSNLIANARYKMCTATSTRRYAFSMHLENQKLITELSHARILESPRSINLEHHCCEEPSGLLQILQSASQNLQQHQSQNKPIPRFSHRMYTLTSICLGTGHYPYLSLDVKCMSQMHAQPSPIRLIPPWFLLNP